MAPPVAFGSINVANGPSHLLTVIGVKYTTARTVAEQAVLHLARRLGHRAAPLAGSGTLGHEGMGLPGRDPGGELRGQVLHAVRAEMAIHLDDVVLRRTDLGTRGRPEPAVLEAVADAMASELGWDGARKAAELARVERAYRSLLGRPWREEAH